MLGEPGSGVHDLEITNVTLEDDGRFQCQVSPDRGQAAIRADAYLTVIRESQLVRPRELGRERGRENRQLRSESQLVSPRAGRGGGRTTAVLIGPGLVLNGAGPAADKWTADA